MKNKKNTLFFISIKILIIVVFAGLCYLNFFQALDFQLYDSLIKLRKQPEQNQKILMVKIDDPSITALGEWPWSRDEIANALLSMKELGADTAIFDIEYISPSKNGIAPSAEQKIYSSIADTEQNVNDLISQMTDALESGYFSLEDLPELKQNLLEDNIIPEFSKLNEYITNNMSRDNDEYFAQCLQFFGKSYLTINHQDLGYETKEDELDYTVSRLLLDSVKDEYDLITIGNNRTSLESQEPNGFTPALHKLLTRSYGANFTNSVIDSDGVRRRMELLYQYNGRYVAQLTFGPFLQIVDSNQIERKSNKYIIKNAINPKTNVRGDIEIPVDEFGRIFINYRKGSCDESFRNDSIINLINLSYLEEQIGLCLSNISLPVIFNDDGSQMDYIYTALDLLQEFQSINNEKEYLLSKCTGYDIEGNVLDGISDEEYQNYFDRKKAFYQSVNDFLNSGYLQTINARINQIADSISLKDMEEIKNIIKNDYDNLKHEYDIYAKFMKEMRPMYEGAYCIIGNTATSTTDNGATPYEKKFMNIGIHANILNTLLNLDFINNINWYWGFLFAALLSMLTILFGKTSNTTQNILIFILYLIYCLFFASLFVFSHYYIRFFGTIVYLAVDLIFGISYRFYQSIVEKRFITQIAASFANKDTVEELRRNPEAFKTEGQKKVITALFSDIQKFSTLSESIGKRYGDEGPNKLIEILNEYLGQMSNEILKNNGNIDKYEGDAIISMFGAPDPMNSHTKEEWAFRCLDSAINMKKVEIEFNQSHADLFKPIEIVNDRGNTEIIKLNPLQTRIGINSGDAYVGLMGSKTDSFSKLNYTMIGDTVNLASRLEGVNKAYNSWIMCSDSTWNFANSGVHKDEITVRKLDRVRVVGRSTPVQLYNVIGFTSELSSLQKEQIDIFNVALERYLNRDFINAGKLFIQANAINEGDPTSLVFAERCKNFIQNGVPENWDGVINMTSK